MDRYDAILEQLKKAQSRGVDSVASRLDAVVANLDELVQTTKATVQSVISTEANETFPIADVEALVAKMREEALVPGGAPSDSGVTLENLRILDRARSQSELLRALLPMLAEHIGRAAVLVIRDEAVSAWSGAGFGDGDALRSWHGEVTASPIIQSLVENSTPLGFSPVNDPLFSRWLGESRPEEAVLLPISLRGKLMGVVYVDHAGDQPWNLDAAQALNAVACWLIDTLQYRTTVPTATLAKIETATVPRQDEVSKEVFEPRVEPVAKEPDEALDFEPSPVPKVEESPPAAPPVATSAVEEIEFEPSAAGDPPPVEEPKEESAADIDYDFEPEAASVGAETTDSGFDPSATVRVDAEVASASPEVSPREDFAPPVAEMVAEPAQPAVAEEIQAPPPVRPVEPPADVQAPVEAAASATARSPEEEARQEEARRFARLLVSEIKLYNEDEVERGRADKDIGVRLKDDIARSREMFEKRIPEDVRTGHDYFRDELVRILADGDADALGV